MKSYKFYDGMFGENSPYYPFYEEYDGHTFVIDHVMVDPEDGELVEDHVWITCVDDPTLIVKGYIHFGDLVEIIT